MFSSRSKTFQRILTCADFTVHLLFVLYHRKYNTCNTCGRILLESCTVFATSPSTGHTLMLRERVSFVTAAAAAAAASNELRSQLVVLRSCKMFCTVFVPVYVRSGNTHVFPWKRKTRKIRYCCAFASILKWLKSAVTLSQSQVQTSSANNETSPLVTLAGWLLLPRPLPHPCPGGLISHEVLTKHKFLLKNEPRSAFDIFCIDF